MQRAYEHLEALKEEFAAHAKGVVVQPELQLDRSQAVVKVVALPEMPIRWSVIVGDIAHNFRSVLDHLTWQAGLRHLGRDPKDNTQFPICNSPELFENAKWRIGDLGDTFRRIVEDCQPYQRDERYDEPFLPLAWLRDLSNMDKHRLLAPTAIATDDSRVEVEWFVGARKLTPYWFVGPPLEVGTDLVRLKLDDPTPEFQAKVNYEYAPYISFYGGSRVDELFDLVGVAVLQVISRFEPEL